MANTKIRCDIIEVNGRDTFAKFKMDAAKINMIMVSFVQFDKTKETGSKIVSQADAYFTFSDAKLLAQDILSGKIAALAKKEKDKGEKYPKPIWTNMGGTNEKKCAEKQLRTDGKAMSRVLTLSPGSKQPFVLTIQQGPGESNEQGLIVPKFGIKPEVQIRVAMDVDTLKKVALMLNTYIDAYITSQFTRGAYETENNN